VLVRITLDRRSPRTRRESALDLERTDPHVREVSIDTKAGFVGERLRNQLIARISSRRLCTA